MTTDSVVRIDRLVDPSLNLPAAIESFIRYCEAKNLSPNTIGYYRYRLEAFRDFADAQGIGKETKAIKRQHIRDFISYEIGHNSASTANHSLAALKACFKYLVDEEFIEENPTAGVQKVKTVKKVIETFTIDQLEAIIGVCGRNFVGIRDKALLLMLFDCGLRASELCEITLDDISWKENTVKVQGKGGKERVVPFSQTMKQALSVYAARRPELATNTLFITCYGYPLNRFRLLQLVKKRCEMAGIMGVRCSPHTFRHTFAVTYLRAGGDVFSLQKLLGHSDLAMTRRYCELSQTDLNQKHKLYSPADRLRSTGSGTGRKRIV